MEKIKDKIFYIIFFLFSLAFSATAVSYDYDLWARLIQGMSVVQKGIVLKQDFLSYTPSHTWYDHEWGSGAIFYFFQHYFDGAGILILQASIIFLIFFIITKTVKLRGVKTTSPYNFLFYFFAFQAMAQVINSPIRCQMFTFVFFTLFLYILELSRQGQNKPLWLLPIIMIIWNNLHGGCVSGIGLILIYIIGEALNKAPFKKYLFVLAPTILVLAINPWGIDYLDFLFSAATMKRPDVIEWWGLFSKYHMYGFMKFKFFAAVMLIINLVFLKNTPYKEIDKTKMFVLLATLILSIQHVKMIPLFVISATCFLYDDFYTLFNNYTKNFFNKFATVKEVIIYSIIIVFALSNLNSKFLEPILNWNTYPLKEIEFIKINKIKGNLLINFGLGSYASYKLYPNNRIFMDGRYEEVYYDNMVPLLKKFYLLNEDWDEILQKYPPAVMVIEKYYPVYNALKISPEWSLIFEGDIFGVFVRTSETKKEYKLPSNDINYYKNTLFDTDINFMLKSKP